MGVSNVIFRLDERFSPSGESVGSGFWKYKPCDACLKHLNAAAVTGSERPRIQGMTSYRLPRKEKSVDFAVDNARVFRVAIEVPFRTVFHALWKTVEPRRAEGMVWAESPHLVLSPGPSRPVTRTVTFCGSTTVVP